MRIIETFLSIQGEGQLAGVVSYFIRFAGCNMQCLWCDTTYARDPRSGQDVSIEQILDTVKNRDCRYVVITGGEPVLNQELSQLVLALKNIGLHTTLETNGTVFSPVACDLISISPKLGNAFQEGKIPEEIRRQTIQAVRQYVHHYTCQIKFVVRDENDVQQARALLADIPGVRHDDVMLMPQAQRRDDYIRRAADVAAWCIRYGYRFSPRLQVELWDGQRGV